MPLGTPCHPPPPETDENFHQKWHFGPKKGSNFFYAPELVIFQGGLAIGTSSPSLHVSKSKKTKKADPPCSDNLRVGKRKPQAFLARPVHTQLHWVHTVWRSPESDFHWSESGAEKGRWWSYHLEAKLEINKSKILSKHFVQNSHLVFVKYPGLDWPIKFWRNTKWKECQIGHLPNVTPLTTWKKLFAP